MTHSTNQLMGSWSATVATPDQGEFPALLTFSTDGAVLASESPSSFESMGHGNWVSREDDTVAFTLIALFGSQEGKNNGRLKVVSTIQSVSEGQHWQGPFKIEVFDATGQVTFMDRGSINLTRIMVETLD